MSGRKKTYKMAALASVSMLLLMSVGCGKKTVRTEGAPVTTTQQAESWERGGPYEETLSQPRYGSDESLETTSLGGRLGAGSGNFLEGRTSGPMLPVYFDYDQFTIREDQMERMAQNASFLRSNPQVHVRIEGNCDERGTEEYNLALGERRAMSAKKYMENMGIEDYRMTTISFGEEKPLHFGGDETTWSRNRRDDFVIID